MNTISFYQPLNGNMRDLAAFISECLLACGCSFNWCADNSELKVTGHGHNLHYLEQDATEYGLLTTPEEEEDY